MKRVSVTLDEELLKQAREATGEKTNSGAITKALEDVARRRRFWEKYKVWAKEVSKGDYFWPEALEETPQPRKRISAHDARVPKTSSRGRTR